MSFATLGWLPAAAVTLHNAEEAVWPRAFAQHRGWRIPVTAAQRIAAAPHRDR